MQLIILSRIPTQDSLRILDGLPETPVLLTGRAILCDLDCLGERPVYVLQEEAQELGLESRLGERVTARPGADVVDLICQSQVLNLG